MATFVQRFFDSIGLKRKVATYLTAVMALMVQYPELQIALPILQYIAGFFGVAGIVHALNKDTIPRFKLASLVSLLGVLMAAAAKFPSLHQYSALLQQIAIVIAPFGAGYVLAASAKK